MPHRDQAGPNLNSRLANPMAGRTVSHEKLLAFKHVAGQRCGVSIRCDDFLTRCLTIQSQQGLCSLTEFLVGMIQ